MKLIGNKKTITSLELLKKINELRKKEYEEKAKSGTLTKSQIKKGKFIELKHKDLLKIIRNEFEEDFNGGNISPVKNRLPKLNKEEKNLDPINKKSNGGKFYLSQYLDSKGEKRDMYILTLSQAKQVLMRESKYVRKAVIEYIEYLENQVKELEEITRLQARELTKVTRNIETLSLKALLEYGEVKKENQARYYIAYSNLARSIAGIPRKIKRDDLSQGELGILQQVELIMTAMINECMSENIAFVLMYQEVRDRTQAKAKTLLKALQRVEGVDEGPKWKIEY